MNVQGTLLPLADGQCEQEACMTHFLADISGRQTATPQINGEGPRKKPTTPQCYPQGNTSQHN